MTHEALAFAACALRCFGFILSLPFGEALQNFPRFFLAAALAAALFSAAVVPSDVTPLSLMFNFAIGFMLGAPLRFVVDMSEMIGELIDTARGQTIASVIDPLNGQGGSNLATISKSGAIACALSLGALEVSLGGLARSVQVIPLGILHIDESFAQGLARSLSFIIVEGLRVSAVWMGAFLLIDIVCAFCSRLLPGLSFIQAGGVIKMVVTFLLVVVLAQEGGRLSLSDFERVLLPWRSLSSSPPLASSSLGGKHGPGPSLPLVGRTP
jgi:flagellar biosynthesis protein FliR